MELLFTYTKIAHGRRIYGKDKELRKKISLPDINNGYEIFLKNRQKKENTFMHTIFIQAKILVSIVYLISFDVNIL